MPTSSISRMGHKDCASRVNSGSAGLSHWLTPLGLLKAGTVETRFFHTRRTAFLRSVSGQRNACLGLGGVLSSAVEIHDHQVGAARRVLADPIPRYLLADEVGLGKTIEAGMVLRQLAARYSAGPRSSSSRIRSSGSGSGNSRPSSGSANSPEPWRWSATQRSAESGPEQRMLTIVDEAHRFTDRVNYGEDGAREQQYEALRADRPGVTSAVCCLARHRSAATRTPFWAYCTSGPGELPPGGSWRVPTPRGNAR